MRTRTHVTGIERQCLVNQASDLAQKWLAGERAAVLDFVFAKHADSALGAGLAAQIAINLIDHGNDGPTFAFMCVCRATESR